jgi:Ni/Fe-hydrogenase subunit HybB-like protein
MSRRTLVTRILVGVWALAFAAGVVGVVWRFVHEDADYGSYIPWGLWIAMYAWFVGLSAGAFMLFAAGEVFRVERLRKVGRPALVVSFASLLSGLVVVGLDLGHVWRFWSVYVWGNVNSLMAWEISFYTVFGLLLTVLLLLAFRNELAAVADRKGLVGGVARTLRMGKLASDGNYDSPWVRPLAFAGGTLAIAVSGATGALFGVVGSRPFWHTGLLPLLFVAVALLSATAVLAVVAALVGDDDGDRTEVTFLGRLTLAMLGVVLLIEWADISIAYASKNLAGWDAYDLILTGSYWWVFWLVHVLMGVAVPLILLLGWPRRIGAVAVAGALIGVTLVAVRLNVVIPGLAVPQLEGLDDAYAERGLAFSYQPTLMEWLVAIFAASVFVGVIGLWYRLVHTRFVAPPQPDAAVAGAEPVETRGEFLGKLGIAGGALVASQLPLALHAANSPGDDGTRPLGSSPYQLAKAENILYTVCQQCNTQCGVKAKLQDGVVVKLDGNPYSPWTMHPPISYETPLTQAAAVDGWLCPKGQAGLQSTYDPYRIRKVLKRAGPRGSGKWRTIPFDQAVAEIVEGGALFADIGEERQVEGLRELWALRDPDLSKEMAEDVDALWHGEITVEDFQAKHADHLDVLIDPDHPDLGPKNNQVVYAWGRLKGGRSEFYKRFFADSFGTTNGHGHTTVCQGSLYFSGKAMSEQFVEGSWTGGAKFYWQADIAGSEFVIFVGASPFEANYGPPYRTSAITDGLASGRLKIAVVDPRLSKTAAKAWKMAADQARYRGCARPGDDPLDHRGGPLRRSIPLEREQGSRGLAGERRRAGDDVDECELAREDRGRRSDDVRSRVRARTGRDRDAVHRRRGARALRVRLLRRDGRGPGAASRRPQRRGESRLGRAPGGGIHRGHPGQDRPPGSLRLCRREDDRGMGRDLRSRPRRHRRPRTGVHEPRQEGGRGHPPRRLPAHKRLPERDRLEQPERPDRQLRLEGRDGQSDDLRHPW